MTALMTSLVAEDLAAVAAAHAESADANRTLDAEVVKGIVAAGFARHFVPRRWGGAAGTATELLAAVSAVARGCASAAWCASLAAGAARMGAYLPERGQSELWATGPDVLVAGALIPSGRVDRADGGWRLSGEWAVTSGADFGEWSLVCAVWAAEPWFFAVPRAAYTVRDTWFPVGMRGTGSNTLELDDVFVPAHRGFAREEMVRGHGVGSTARCHTVPLRVVSGLLFAAPAIGAAQGALRAWVDSATTRPLPADRLHAAHLALARSAAEIDAAQLVLARAAAVGDQESITAAETARNPADCAWAVDQLVGAVERLFRTAGSRGQRAGPLERSWRDVHCLAGHVALQFDTAGAGRGAQLLSARSETHNREDIA